MQSSYPGSQPTPALSWDSSKADCQQDSTGRCWDRKGEHILQMGVCLLVWRCLSTRASPDTCAHTSSIPGYSKHATTLSLKSSRGQNAQRPLQAQYYHEFRAYYWHWREQAFGRYGYRHIKWVLWSSRPCSFPVSHRRQTLKHRPSASELAQGDEKNFLPQLMKTVLLWLAAPQLLNHANTCQPVAAENTRQSAASDSNANAAGEHLK